MLIIHINNEPILIHSTQVADIVQYMFAGEAGEGEGDEEEMTGGSFYHYLPLWLEILPFLSTSISIARHSYAHMYQKLTYVYMYIYLYLELP